MVLPRVPGKERVGFILDMFTQMMDLGTAGLTDEQVDEMKTKIQELLDNAKSSGAVPETKVNEAPLADG